MGDEVRNPVSKIRTFAADLDLQRQNRDSKKTGPVVEPKQEVVPPEVPKPEPEKPKFKLAPRPPVPVKESPIVQEEIKPKVVVQPILPRVETAPPAAVKMPAFHELQKQTSTIQNTPVPIATSTEPGKSKEKTKANIGYDATVITDTKSKRFRLFPSIVDSIKNWFKKRKVKKNTPKYTVPDAVHRKGVIQQATSKSGSMFTADSDSIRDQIRRRQAEAEQAEKNQVPEIPEPETETHWSPYVEPGYELLEKEASKDVTTNVEVAYRMSPAPTPIFPISQETRKPEFSVPVTKTEILPVAKETVTASPAKEAEDNRWSRTEESYRNVSLPSNDPEIPIAIPAKKRTLPKTEKTSSSSSSFSNFDTNTLTITILFVIVGLVIVIVVSRVALQFYDRQSVEIPVSIIAPEPLVPGATVQSIILESDTVNQLPKIIREAVAGAGGGTTEIVIMAPNGTEISRSYIFDLLDFDTLPTLKQSLTNVRFVSVDGAEGMVLLQFVDETTVRGGLLYWEASIQGDLSTFYNLQNSTSSKFVDETIHEVDVRILKDNEGEILLYGILDENTALIAKNRSDFTKIIETLKQN